MDTTIGKKIKVLIVDDSVVSQKLYQGLLSNDLRFEIVAIASNGQQAIDYVTKYKPDVVSMDINMPLMDGVEATRQIMQRFPIPIVIVSSMYQSSEVEMAMEVLEAGAVAIIPKPYGPGHPRFAFDTKNYIRMLSIMSEVKVVRRRVISKEVKSTYNPPEQNSVTANFDQLDFKILVIGASAGGPESVKSIISRFDSDFPVPILIVQHIDPHFAEGYRAWLQTNTNIKVVAADKQQQLNAGHAYLSCGDFHLVVTAEGSAALTSDPPTRGHRPSVANLFSSAAKVYGNKAIAVILSGMGSDGAMELKLLKDKGALTFAQDQQSCLVFGMPGEAIKLGGALKVLPPQEIADEIIKILTKKN